MVITNQIENTNGGKYIGSGTGIDIAVAWVMKNGQNKRFNMRWQWS